MSQDREMCILLDNIKIITKQLNDLMSSVDTEIDDLESEDYNNENKMSYAKRKKYNESSPLNEKYSKRKVHVREQVSPVPPVFLYQSIWNYNIVPSASSADFKPLPPAVNNQDVTFISNQNVISMPTQNANFIPNQNDIFITNQDAIFLPNQNEIFIPNQDANFIPNQNDISIRNQDDTSAFDQDATSISNQDTTPIFNQDVPSMSNQVATYIFNQHAPSTSNQGATSTSNQKAPSIFKAANGQLNEVQIGEKLNGNVLIQECTNADVVSRKVEENLPKFNPQLNMFHESNINNRDAHLQQVSSSHNINMQNPETKKIEVMKKNAMREQPITINRLLYLIRDIYSAITDSESFILHGVHMFAKTPQSIPKSLPKSLNINVQLRAVLRRTYIFLSEVEASLKRNGPYSQTLYKEHEKVLNILRQLVATLDGNKAFDASYPHTTYLRDWEKERVKQLESILAQISRQVRRIRLNFIGYDWYINIKRLTLKNPCQPNGLRNVDFVFIENHCDPIKCINELFKKSRQ